MIGSRRTIGSFLAAVLLAAVVVLVAPSSAHAGTYSEQAWKSGANAFRNYHNASGVGPHIDRAAWVEVTCKVYDPTIASVNPAGYWYRIASAPWNNEFYAPANSFMNGDSWSGPFTHYVDYNVPDCSIVDAAPPPPPPPPPRSITLAQGPAAPQGWRYAITLNNFAANTNFTVSCRASWNPTGFYSFSIRTNGAGSASTQTQCYTGDGPDHWVVADGVESNHVSWGGGSGGGSTNPSPTTSPPVTSPPISTPPTTAAPQPSQGDGILSILVLGDSYSAGNGAGQYFGDAGCYRSSNNYARQFQRLIEAANSTTRVFVENRACSGAITADYWNGRSGRPAERAWVNRGYDEIFLTFGGNDAFFKDIATYCLVGITRDGANCNPNLGRAEQMLNNGTIRGLLFGVLRDIRSLAKPSAKIVLIGYPHLEADPSYTLRSGHGSKAPIIEVGKRIRALIDSADAMQRGIVEQLNRESGGFVFVSTKATFAGPPTHELYAQKTNPNRWFNQPQVDGGIANSEGWYHPNYTGHQAEAKLLYSDSRIPKSDFP